MGNLYQPDEGINKKETLKKSKMMLPVSRAYSMDGIERMKDNISYLKEILGSNFAKKIAYETQMSYSLNLDELKKIFLEGYPGGPNQLMNFQISTSSDNNFVYDWLSRVNNQFHKRTPKQVKEVDFEYAKENVKKGKIFTALFPGMQAVEGAKNYLLNTIYAKSLKKLKEIADIQLNIDAKSLSKTRGYKNAILAGLIGIITIGAGSVSTRFSTVRTIAVIAGIAINTIAVLYATYNCRLHWNDKVDGEQELNKVQNLINELLSVYPEKLNPQSSKEEQDKKKQEEEKKVIFNQRGDPSKIYSNDWPIHPIWSSSCDSLLSIAYGDRLGLDT